MRPKINWCMEYSGEHYTASAVRDKEQSDRLFPYGIPLGVLRRFVLYARCAGKTIYGFNEKNCGENGLGCFFRK